MTKKYLALGIVAVALSMVSANATPVFTSDLGGLQYNAASGTANAKNVNDAIDIYTNPKNEVDSSFEDYTVPASANTKYSFGRGTVDTSSNYDYSDESSRGVNASKTIYKDDLGRLHFFGKKNVVRE